MYVCMYVCNVCTYIHIYIYIYLYINRHIYIYIYIVSLPPFFFFRPKMCGAGALQPHSLCAFGTPFPILLTLRVLHISRPHLPPFCCTPLEFLPLGGVRAAPAPSRPFPSCANFEGGGNFTFSPSLSTFLDEPDRALAAVRLAGNGVRPGPCPLGPWLGPWPLGSRPWPLALYSAPPIVTLPPSFFSIRSSIYFTSIYYWGPCPLPPAPPPHPLPGRFIVGPWPRGPWPRHTTLNVTLGSRHMLERCAVARGVLRASLRALGDGPA